MYLLNIFVTAAPKWETKIDDFILILAIFTLLINDEAK